MLEPLAALFIAANPEGTDPVRLDRELRAIRESLDLSRYRGRLHVEIRTAATWHDLRRALLDQPYDLVHISGHGEREGLILEDEKGDAVQVPPQSLAQLFAQYAAPEGRLRCVVLNACYSLSSGESIALQVPFTIAMEGAIADGAALEFSRGFYDALGAGKDFARAYAEGQVNVSAMARSAPFQSVLLTSKREEPDKLSFRQMDEDDKSGRDANPMAPRTELREPIPPSPPPVAPRPTPTADDRGQTKDLTNDDLDGSRSEPKFALPLPALVLVWSREEPERIGEVVLIGPRLQNWVLGRETAENRNEPGRLELIRQSPGHNQSTGQFHSPKVSRGQLELRAVEANRIFVRNCATRRPMRINGKELAEAHLVPGDVLELRKIAVFLCTLRPGKLPIRPHLETLEGGRDFGGLIGQSPAIWALRDRLAFAAKRRDTHVLIHGPRGSGKELAAAMIHSLSHRAHAPFVACNAATLLDAELFGSAEQPGLIDAAAGGTLFMHHLDELPEELHPRVLRLLERGDYQRLGETQTRHIDLRFIGGTDDPDGVEPDLSSRIKLPIEAPGLDARREDIPLLILHLLRKIAVNDAELAARFFVNGDPRGWPRVNESLVRELLIHKYTSHVRELEQLLYTGMQDSSGDYIELASVGLRTDTGAVAPLAESLDPTNTLWRKPGFDPKKQS
jgi:transcriptional regulator with AAA-type ATPase domain